MWKGVFFSFASQSRRAPQWSVRLLRRVAPRNDDGTSIIVFIIGHREE
jgi:hypothetical protein